jgi:hypothetical protein
MPRQAEQRQTDGTQRAVRLQRRGENTFLLKFDLFHFSLIQTGETYAKFRSAVS